MKLLVQEFLETHSFKELQEQHGVYASFSKSGHKFSLNYDQIEAKESDPLAQECRGLILAREDGKPIFADMTSGKPNRDNMIPGKTTILAYPMKRFFNYGQGCAAQIDWSDMSVMEKLDGTLCIVYWDPFAKHYDGETRTMVERPASYWGKWCVATRSVPEADIPLDNGLYTFRTLFEKAFLETVKVSFEDFSNTLDKNFTYCFELTTPYNRIVVDYKECGVTLLAVRSMLTYLEVSPHSTLVSDCLQGVPIVKTFKFDSIQNIIDWVSSQNPLEYEGVVVRDSSFNRIKMKNAAYVAYNKLHDRLGSSERNCMEFVLLEKDDDVAPFLAPEIGANMAKLKEGLKLAIQAHDTWYDGLKTMMQVTQSTDKKTFAIGVQTLAKEHPKKMWPSVFFALWDGKASSMKDFIQKNRKDGTWGDSFLDKILELAKAHST